MALSPLAQRYDHLLCDLDGCVWVGDEPTDRVAEVLEAWRAADKRVAFVTNETRLTEQEFVRKLWGLGVQASVEEVVTAGGALQHVLAEHGEWRTAYVIGAASVWRYVEGAGKRIVNHTAFAERADVVVVAVHDGFDHDELQGAIRCALRGAAVLAATRDSTYPRSDGPAPGTGAIVAAVEFGAGVRAMSVGKPEPQLFVTALERLGAGADARVLVVGDRLDADVAGAHALGLDAALISVDPIAAPTDEGDPTPVAVGVSLASLLLR